MSGIDPVRSEYNEHLPILPSTLGGSLSRKKCYTFSVTKASRSVELGQVMHNFELITRHDDETIDYKVSKSLLASTPPSPFSDPGGVLNFHD